MDTEGELKALDSTYQAEVKAAEDRRSTTIARAIDRGGWQQKDVMAATGYSRETVRRLTNAGRKLLRGG